MNGDRLAVGTIHEDSNATGIQGNWSDNTAALSGAVYIFRRNSNATWVQEAYVKASNTGASDFFGYSIALSSDALAVGAIGEDSNSATNQADNSLVESGAVYVYRRNGTSWAQEAYVKAPSPGADDWFGSAVGISGDVLAVGAQNDATGVAYVYRRSGTTWSYEARIDPESTTNVSAFGYSLGVAGNVVVVGAYLERGGATGVNGDPSDGSADASGAAYLFYSNETAWEQGAYIKASNTDASDHFGEVVAISDDAVVVSATQESSSAAGINGDEANDNASSSGAIYVFR
jgi:trimeric autotransporter adhesin